MTAGPRPADPLLIRPDAYHAATADGCAVLTSDGWVRFTGASIAAWLDWLVPRLDGSCSLDELIASLPPAHADHARRIIAALGERKVLVPAGGPEPPRTPGSVIVVGSGALAGALADATRATTAARVREVQVTDSEAILAELGEVDLVLHAADEPTSRLIELLDQWCAPRAVPVVHAVSDGAAIWLVPPQRSGSAAGAWSAALPRIGGGGSVGDVDANPDRSVVVKAAAAMVAAGQLVHRLVEPPTHPGRGAGDVDLLRLDVQTLRTDSHRVLPHPFARSVIPEAAADLDYRLTEIRQRPRLTEEQFSVRAARAVDDRCGVLTLPEHGWSQTPLNVAEAQSVDPGPSAAAGRCSGIGAGFNLRTARCRATLIALARYAASFLDPRRLLTPGGQPFLPLTADPWQGLERVRNSAEPAVVWAVEPDDAHRVRPVPVWAAYPRWCRSAGAAPNADDGVDDPHRPPLGVGAGYDWQEAVAAGLLSHVRHRALARVTGGGPWLPIDPAALPLNDEGERARDLLEGLGALPEIYDVTGPLGVPTVALCSGQRMLACEAALTVAEAVSAGLLRVLLGVQAATYGEPGYAPPAIRPRQHRTGHARTAPPPPAAGVTDVVARLRRAGATVAVVPLHHDPAVADIIPYLVRVVIFDGQVG